MNAEKKIIDPGVKDYLIKKCGLPSEFEWWKQVAEYIFELKRDLQKSAMLATKNRKEVIEIQQKFSTEQKRNNVVEAIELLEKSGFVPEIKFKKEGRDDRATT